MIAEVEEEIYAKREIKNSDTQRANKYAELDVGRSGELSEDAIAHGEKIQEKYNVGSRTMLRNVTGNVSAAGRFKE